MNRTPLCTRYSPSLFRMFLIVVIAFFAILSVYAEPTQLTIEEAITRALEANFNIKTQEYQIKKLRIDKSSSWRVLIPTVTAGGTISKLNTKPEVSAFNPDPLEWSLTRNISVASPVGGKLAQNIIDVFVPFRSYQAGDINFQEMLASTAINVQKSYIGMYIAQQQMSLLAEKLETQIAKEQAMQEDYSLGIRDEFSYLQTQFQVIKSQQAFDQQKNTYQNLSEQFALLVGYPLDTEFTLVDKVQEVDNSTIELWLQAEGIENNYSIQNLIVQDRILRLNSTQRYFGYFPQISLAWASRYDFGTDPTTTSWVDSEWGDDIGALSLTLIIPLSEYHPWSNTTVAIRNLAQEQKINKLQQEQTLQSVKQQIAAKKRSLKQAVDALAIQEQQLDITQRAYELAKESYNSGLINLTSYQDAEDNVYDAQITYLALQSDIIQNILDISILVGERISPNLKEEN